VGMGLLGETGGRRAMGTGIGMGEEVLGGRRGSKWGKAVEELCDGWCPYAGLDMITGLGEFLVYMEESKFQGSRALEWRFEVC